MRQVIKTEDGIFIPKELIPGFERVEVDTSDPRVIVIRSPRRSRGLEAVLARIDQRREAIRRRRGVLSDSTLLIREDRDSDER